MRRSVPIRLGLAWMALYVLAGEAAVCVAQPAPEAPAAPLPDTASPVTSARQEQPFSDYLLGRYSLPAALTANQPVLPQSWVPMAVQGAPFVRPAYSPADVALTPAGFDPTFLLDYRPTGRGATGRMMHSLLANATARQPQAVRRIAGAGPGMASVHPIAAAHLGRHVVVGFVWQHGRR